MELNNVKLITPYGTVILNGTITDSGGNFKLTANDHEFSNEAADLIGRTYAASQIFFAEDIDITDLELDDDIIDELVEVVASASYNNVSKALAIKQFTGADLSKIFEYPSGEFVINNAEYLVLDDAEATKKAREAIRDYLNEIDLDSFAEIIRRYAKDNFVDPQWFEEAMVISSKSYARDIQYEYAEKPYLNRLHKEMVELGIMDEPEWPEEPEKDQEDYDEAYEEWEAAAKEYIAELKDEIKNKIDEFTEKRIESEDSYTGSINNSNSWYHLLKDTGIIDVDKLVDWILSEDGRGTWLANYNQIENEETVTYKGETKTYYIYRIS